MAVSVDEEVDIGMRFQILFRVQYQMLTVLTQINGLVSLLVRLITMPCPVESEPHSPTRMNGVEQFLAGWIMEHAAQQLELYVGVAQSVTMSQEEYLVVYLDGRRLPVQNDTTLFLQVSVGP